MRVLLPQREINYRGATLFSWLVDDVRDTSCYKRAIQTKQFLLKAAYDDFQRYHPRLVLVSNVDFPHFFTPTKSHGPSSLVDFFMQNTKFKKLWKAHYYLWKVIGSYHIYKRRRNVIE